MVILVKLLNSLIALVGAVFAFIKFGKFYVAVAAYLAVYALIKAINAVLLNYYYIYMNKNHPDPVIHFFQDRNFDNQTDDERSPLQMGMRVMIVTEDLDGDEYLDYYKKMEQESIEALDQPKTIFNLRYHFVLDRNLPYQAVWSLCGPKGKYVNKCVKTWYKTNALTMMTVKQPNREIFVYDGHMDIEGRGIIQYSTFFVFDHALPVTIKL